jgi:LmeA-like phospholipid-binding
MAEHKRRWGRILLILALVLIVLVGVADRVAAHVAEQTISSKARDQLAAEQITTSAPPSVSIAGFPFLTQVLAGNYHEIDIKLANPTSRGVRLDDLTVVATNVSAPASGLMNGNATVVAAKVTGAAHIGWNSVQQLADLSGLDRYGLHPDMLRIEPADSGKVRISAPVTVLGQSFNVVATGSVRVTSGVLHVSTSSIQAGDSSLPSAVNQQLDQLKNALSFDIKLPPLPYHLSVDSVSANSAGVQINASAQNVSLTG